MVIQLRRRESIKIEGRKQEDTRSGFGIGFLEDVERRLPAFVFVKASDVEIVLVGSDFVKEVRTGAKRFDIEELGFFQGVEAFYVGIGIGAGRRDELLACAESDLDGVCEASVFVVNCITTEFTAIVCLHSEFVGWNTVLVEVVQ